MKRPIRHKRDAIREELESLIGNECVYDRMKYCDECCMCDLSLYSLSEEYWDEEEDWFI
jgi:hypothetical protein